MIFAGFLLALNVFIWQEVFALAKHNYLKVDFLDVDQGDSIFIKTPENHQILIDGGPDSKILQKLAERMPFWDKTIDLVILTHPEKDHMQGLLDLFLRYKIDYFLWTGIIKNNAENKKLVSILNEMRQPRQPRHYFGAGGALFPAAKTTKVITASTGQEIKAGKILIEILYPLENLAEKELKDTSNDTSIVLKLIFGKDSFLFTGDISSSAEKELADSKESIESDVLKVAHHGSKYSTSDLFLENVKPKIAVISVGKNNFYGHPTPEVLQKLENFGIKVMRTDIDGDVEILSDGKNIKLVKQQ